MCSTSSAYGGVPLFLWFSSLACVLMSSVVFTPPVFMKILSKSNTKYASSPRHKEATKIAIFFRAKYDTRGTGFG